MSRWWQEITAPVNRCPRPPKCTCTERETFPIQPPETQFAHVLVITWAAYSVSPQIRRHASGAFPPFSLSALQRGNKVTPLSSQALGHSSTAGEGMHSSSVFPTPGAERETRINPFWTCTLSSWGACKQLFFPPPPRATLVPRTAAGLL